MRERYIPLPLYAEGQSNLPQSCTKSQISIFGSNPESGVLRTRSQWNVFNSAVRCHVMHLRRIQPGIASSPTRQYRAACGQLF